MEHFVLIAAGSNYYARRNMVKARRLTEALLTVQAASRLLPNAAIGIEAPLFTNQLLLGTTPLGAEELKARLKDIETRCGDSRELRTRRRVAIDLDLLAHGSRQHHTADWQRPYIKALLEELAPTLAGNATTRRWLGWAQEKEPADKQ